MTRLFLKIAVFMIVSNVVGLPIGVVPDFVRLLPQQRDPYQTIWGSHFGGVSGGQYSYCGELKQVDYSLSGIPIVNCHLENEKCTKINTFGEKEVVFRNAAPERNIEGIMLLYSVVQSSSNTIRGYYATGTSTHYCIEHDGGILGLVDPDKYIAFFAGRSKFREFESLNKSFIGIDHVNPGFEELGKEYDYDFWGKSTQIYGDNRKWFSFPMIQLDASGCLIAALQKKYRIRGSCVLAHADGRLGEKSDPGPLFDWEGLFENYGAGYWPTHRNIDLSSFSDLSDSVYMGLLEVYGYRGSKQTDIIRAFQMHFSPGDISGTLSNDTKVAIINLIADYNRYNDKYQGVDKEFQDKLAEYATEMNISTLLGEISGI